jgi:hypothetical protein
MAIPIKIEKVIVGSSNGEAGYATYQITVSEKGHKWDRMIRCSEKDLIRLREEITQILNDTSIAEKLGVSNKQANELEEHYNSDELCQNCSYRLSNDCLTCIFELQSPLERKLFLALKRSYIRFNTQWPLNWQGENISIAGKTYDNPNNNFKDVLTIVDFFIEKRNTKLCVYTDGHTYHERTEEQAQRDKRIDRKLQEFGFQVLRYTGKDVNESVENIVSEIKKWIE